MGRERISTANVVRLPYIVSISHHINHVRPHTVEKQYHSKPCRRISKLLSTYIGGKIDQNWLRFGIEYPKELKVISQSKEVDGHALIGNIGGYIGLFLGTRYFS